MSAVQVAPGRRVAADALASLVQRRGPAKLVEVPLMVTAAAKTVEGEVEGEVMAKAGTGVVSSMATAMVQFFPLLLSQTEESPSPE